MMPMRPPSQARRRRSDRQHPARHQRLIDGLQDFLNDCPGDADTPVVTSFDAGNIILGGDGSDLIMGRGGDDLIDGDAWLNVRISVRSRARS